MIFGNLLALKRLLLFTESSDILSILSFAPRPGATGGGVWGGDTPPQKFHSEVQSAEFSVSRQTEKFLDTKQYCRREETEIFVNQKSLGTRKNM